MAIEKKIRLERSGVAYIPHCFVGCVNGEGRKTRVDADLS